MFLVLLSQKYLYLLALSFSFLPIIFYFIFLSFHSIDNMFYFFQYDLFFVLSKIKVTSL